MSRHLDSGPALSEAAVARIIRAELAPLQASLAALRLQLDEQRESAPQLSPTRLLTIGEIAREFGVSQSAIQRWRRDGLPVHRLGPMTVRYDKDEVRGWLDARPA